ncbi:MAG: hypothetical protein LBQ68_07320 [Clostridiales bacterium]|jgi:hypothetical protein|nr:hypothetical protein [Clostridiales bacterium]
MILEKLDVIIALIGALIVLIIGILSGESLPRLSFELILTIITFYILGAIIRNYLKKNIFTDDIIGEDSIEDDTELTDTDLTDSDLSNAERKENAS